MVGSHGNYVHPRHVCFDVLLKKYDGLIARAAQYMGFSRGRSGSNNHGMEWEDAIQAASIGLWQAQESFDASLVEKDCKDPFLPYAFVKCWQEVSNEFRRCQWSPNSKNREAFQVEHCDIWPSKTDPWGELEDQEWLELIDASIKRMDVKRRHLYQGVMRYDGHGHDGYGHKGYGARYCQTWDISSSRLTQLRIDIRAKLKAGLN